MDVRIAASRDMGGDRVSVFVDRGTDPADWRPQRQHWPDPYDSL
jgi:hypothetical protein